ncbi:MAG: hypothetical protein KDK23_07665 [Leptospiraceae bacterium]|nr:hypothetical protein [Leptospiraceae bacterium]
MVRHGPRLGGYLLAFWLGSLLFSVTLQALPLVDPSLDYRTYRTEHFAIHYPRGYLQNAVSLGNLAEARHSSLEQRYQSGVDVTNIILIPRTDTVNAFASTYVVNRVALYVQSPLPGEFSRYDLWQDHLFTHEYTHILTLYPYSGLPNTLIRIVAGLPPNVLSPTGLVEGFPVYEESQSGKGRLNDPLTDMIFRAAVQENRFPSLEETMSGSHRWPLGSTPYLFGGRFVQFLREDPEFQQSGASAKLDSYFLQEAPPVLSATRLQGLGFPDIQSIYDSFYEMESIRARSETLSADRETVFRRLTFSGFSKEHLQLRGNRLFFFGFLPDNSGIYSLPLPSRATDDVRAESPTRSGEESEWSLNPLQWLYPELALDALERPEGLSEPYHHSLSLFRHHRSSGGFTILDTPDSLLADSSANDAEGNGQKQESSDDASAPALVSDGESLISADPGYITPYILASQESYFDASGIRYQLFREGSFTLNEVNPGQRILFPSSRGQQIVFIKREDPARYLMLGRLDPAGGIRSERTLLSVDLHGILSHSVIAPDGSLAIALFRRKGVGHPVLIGCDLSTGYSHVAAPDSRDSRGILDSRINAPGRSSPNRSRRGQQNPGTRGTEKLAPRRHCDVLASAEGIITQPSFSRDGIVFSADVSGRYEIYKLRWTDSDSWAGLLYEEKHSIVQLSQTNTGLFYPVEDGTHLYALRYFSHGYDIVSMAKKDLISRDVSGLFSRSDGSSELQEFSDVPASFSGLNIESYQGPLEMRPYFAGLLFGVSAAESGIVAFDPLERHQLSIGLGIIEDTIYAAASYSYNRYAHGLNLSYARSSLEKRAFYCDAPSGVVRLLCLEDDYQFEYASASIDRDIPGREVDQYYTLGLQHEKHRNTRTLASPVFPVQDLNLASVYAGYGISNAVYFAESISPERGFSLYGEAAFYPLQWVRLYDNYSDNIDSGEFYSVETELEFFLPFFFEHHVPYLAARGRWTSGKNPEIYRVRLSSYMRGLVPEYSTYGRGALVFTAEYRFPLFWLSRRLIAWWPSLGIRYVSLAPFFDYGQSFEEELYRDTWIRSYGVYTDIGLNIFYLPIALRLTYARGEGPSGETSYGIGLLVGATAPGLQKRNRDPFAHSLMQSTERRRKAERYGR